MSEDTIILTIDEKVAVTMGGGTEDDIKPGDKKEKRHQIPFWGVTLTTKTNGVTSNSHVGIVSRQHGKSAMMAIHYMKDTLFNSETFKDLISGKKRLIFRCDTGLVSYEMLYFVIVVLPTLYQNLDVVSFFPFVALHGKSDVDRFFGIIETWISWYTINNKISNVNEVETAINDGMKQSLKFKQYKISKKRPTTTTPSNINLTYEITIANDVEVPEKYNELYMNNSLFGGEYSGKKLTRRS